MMLDRLINRRKVLPVLGSGVLAGCGMVDKSPFFSTIATFNKNASAAINREKIEAIPYASLLAWFDGNTRALLVLGQFAAEGRLVWYSAEHQALTTWGPFAQSLIGAETDLHSTSFLGQWSDDLRKLDGRSLQKTLEFTAPTNRASVRTVSRFELGAIEEVEVVDRRRLLRNVRESVVANGRHHYSNDYWIEDSTGFCWRSRQLVIPTMPKLNLVVAKPARDA